MPKLPQFLAKLSSKQIYGIFAFAIVLFVIIGFVVAQNVQNYGKNSSSQTNSQNSNSNSATNSTNDSKKSSQNSVSNSASLNANSTSSESQNPYFINNSANSESENPAKSLNSSNKTGEINPNSNQDSDQNSQKRYFKGKIGDLPIRMILEISSNNSTITDSSFVNWYTGSYIYENKSNEKIILDCGIIRSEQVAKLDSNHQFNGVGTKFKEFECDESVIKSEMRTGSMQGIIHATGSFADESFDNQFSGTWSNPDKTVKLPFSLEKAEEFKLEDFLKKGDSKELTYDERNIKNEFTQKGCKEYRIDKEILFNSKKYIQFSGFGLCNGNVNRPWAIFEVSAGGGLAKLYGEEISGGGMLEISPGKDKIVLLSGSHGGFCYDTYFFKILDLNKRELAKIDNKPDNSGKYTLFVQFEPKWLDNNTIEFKERKVSEKDCQNNTENLNKFDEVKTIKIN